MRKLKTILMTAVMASSLFAAAGTAWGHSASLQRGTAWTDFDGAAVPNDPVGVSWEILWPSLDY